MFHDAYPRDTHARTKRRLDRHGPASWVVLLNAFEWVSLALHHSLWRIIGATLALAIASRAELAFVQFLASLALAWFLLLLPAWRAGRTTWRQIALHRMATRVWSRDAHADADDDEHATRDS